MADKSSKNHTNKDNIAQDKGKDKTTNHLQDSWFPELKVLVLYRLFVEQKTVSIFNANGILWYVDYGSRLHNL